MVLNDLAELGEMPAVPLAYAHHVVVQLFVQVVQQRDSLILVVYANFPICDFFTCTIIVSIFSGLNLTL